MAGGSPQKSGHVRISIDGTQWQAHRWVWAQLHGPIPKGKQILHHCDVPPCIEDTHLYVGTTQDNAADRVRRGRTVGPERGEKHHQARLTWKKVRAIRTYYAAGNVSQQALADWYGVAQMTISKLVRGETWKEPL